MPEIGIIADAIQRILEVSTLADLENPFSFLTQSDLENPFSFLTQSDLENPFNYLPQSDPALFDGSVSDSGRPPDPPDQEKNPDKPNYLRLYVPLTLGVSALAIGYYSIIRTFRDGDPIPPTL